MRGCLAFDADGEGALAVGGAFGNDIGTRFRQRPHIGLERGVGPVALVLHLEGVALHLDGAAKAGRGFVGDRRNVESGLVGADPQRKEGLLARAVAVDEAQARRRLLGQHAG